MATTFDIKELKAVLVSGQRMLGSSLRQSTFTMSTSGGYLICSFHGDVIKYGAKMKAEGSIPTIAIDSDTLVKVIGSKSGDVTLSLSPGNTEVSIKNKTFSAKIPTLSYDTDSVEELPVGKKPNLKSTMDASSLTSIPKSALSIFKSIRDNISKEELSVTAVWAGRKLTVMLADGFHGSVLSIKLPKKVEKSTITLPAQVFLKVIEIGSHVHIDESTVTSQSKTEYLKCVVQNTSNQYITLKMMDSVLDSKIKSYVLIDKSSLSDAVASCQSVAVDTSKITLDLLSPNKKVAVSIKSPSGAVAEKLNVQETKGNKVSASISVGNLKDVISCMNSTFQMSWAAGDVMLFESASENVIVRGVCRAVT